MKTPPSLRGNLEAELSNGRIVIAGDPEGLKSLANMIQWLAAVDQNAIETMPDGERAHVHLYGGSALSDSSTEVELCRLDAKTTGAFPKTFKSAGAEERSVAYPEWFMDL